MGRETVRRPLKSRDTRWAATASAWLARRSVQPNAISLASILFAALAGACLLLSRGAHPVACALLYIAAAVFAQMRLLCNLLDGMVAVEGGFQTKSGEVFNDLPDRVSDLLILVPAGYALSRFAWGPELGWLAGSLAVLVAYIRVLGGSAGLTQSFMGPMAKPHRMATLTVGLACGAAGAIGGHQETLLLVALLVIVAGSILTFVRRTMHVIRGLERR